MNTNLFNALKQIILNYGGVATLSDTRRVHELLAELAEGEPDLQKNALIACIEHGSVPLLQNTAVAERIVAKAQLAYRLNHEEGLDKALCTDTLDLLEAVLCGGVSPKLASLLTPLSTRPVQPQPQASLPNGLEYSVNANGEGVTITGYTGSADSVDIPACIQGLPVTAIGEGAFNTCERLRSISLPSSVTAIEKRAFAGCCDLTSISLPSSVTTIGDWAFFDCIRLTSVSLPSSVTAIGEGAFFACSSLASICIPSSVSAIGVGAFYACWSLTSIEVDAGNSAFTSVDGILFDRVMQTIVAYPGGREGPYTIPSSVTTIGGKAFSGCRSLTSISIPPAVTAIGRMAFSGCRSLTSISIPPAVTAIGEWAFAWCRSLTSISIPSSVATIGEWAFCDCRSLTSISIPSSVATIGQRAFYECSSLRSVTLSQRTQVGEDAFPDTVERNYRD